MSKYFWESYVNRAKHLRKNSKRFCHSRKNPRKNSKFWCFYSIGVTEMQPPSEEEGPRDIGKSDFVGQQCSQSYIWFFMTLYYKMRQIFLQMRQLFYYKMRQKFITKCVRLFIIKYDSFITNCASHFKMRWFYYKMRRYRQFTK